LKTALLQTVKVKQQCLSFSLLEFCCNINKVLYFHFDLRHLEIIFNKLTKLVMTPILV